MLYMEAMMMKFVKALITIIILVAITMLFILRVDHLKFYALLIPTFLMYIFIPLLVVLNLIVRSKK